MKNKTLSQKTVTRLWVLTIIAVLIVLMTVLTFLLNFRTQIISDNISDWGSLGSYIGGILSPVISFISLIVLAYITYLVSRNNSEENRNLNLLKRRLDAFEELIKYYNKVNTKGWATAIIVNSILTELKKTDVLTITTTVKNLSEKLNNEIVFFFEYYYFLNSFDKRYSHIFEYDFSNDDYNKVVLTANLVSEDLNTFCSDINSQNFSAVHTDVESLFKTHTTHLNNLIEELRLELT